MISKILEYFRPRPLAPSVIAALEAGEAQARRWGQDYVGVEHLLWGLMETLPFDHPDWDLLDPLAICWETVKRTIVEVASQPQNRLQPTILPRTPRCDCVLRLARKFARLGHSAEVEVPFVLEAIMEEAGSVASYAISVGITGLPLVTEASPNWLVNAAGKFCMTNGRAWEIPRNSASKLRDAFRPELDDWKEENIVSRTLIHAGKAFRFHTYLTDDPEDAIRALLEPKVSSWDSFSNRYRQAYAAICDILAEIAIREISRKQFIDDWPTPEKHGLGALEHEFLAGKRPSGPLRLFTPDDAQPCREIYSILETKAFVPPGYAGEFEQWLQKPIATRFILEIEGQIVGCCGFTISAPIDPIEPLGNVTRDSLLTFGIIHPDFLRQGLGRTQLAVRLALALHMKARCVNLCATETSKPFLESAGFKFWRRYRSELGDLLHEGTLLLTDADTAVLQPWLALLSEDCLERIAPAACD